MRKISCIFIVLVGITNAVLGQSFKTKNTSLDYKIKVNWSINDSLITMEYQKNKVQYQNVLTIQEKTIWIWTPDHKIVDYICSWGGEKCRVFLICFKSKYYVAYSIKDEHTGQFTAIQYY